MLKIVPDPPIPSFEDLLTYAAEHLTCAQFLTRKITRVHPGSVHHEQLLAAANDLQTIYDAWNRCSGRPKRAIEPWRKTMRLCQSDAHGTGVLA